MNILKRTIGKCIFFGSNYILEGLMVALSLIVVPLYLASLKVDPSLIGLIVGFTGLPWVIKFVWGSIVDKLALRRKDFMRIAILIAAPCLLLIPSVKNILLFSILLFLARLGVAFLDVSNDALSIDVTHEKERGIVNGAMFSGQLLGFSLGSLFFPQNLMNSFRLAGLASLAFIIPTFFVEEGKRKKGELKKMLKLVRQRFMIALMIFAILIHLPDGIVFGMVAYYMKEFLFFRDELVGLIMLGNGILSAIGSLIFGKLSDLYGRRSAFFLLIISTLALYPFLSFLKGSGFVALFIACGLMSGGFASVICAKFMDVTSKEVAATEFALLTSIANFGYYVGNSISGFLLKSLGGNFFISSIIPLIPALRLCSRI